MLVSELVEPIGWFTEELSKIDVEVGDIENNSKFSITLFQSDNLKIYRETMGVRMCLVKRFKDYENYCSITGDNLLDVINKCKEREKLVEEITELECIKGSMLYNIVTSYLITDTCYGNYYIYKSFCDQYPTFLINMDGTRVKLFECKLSSKVRFLNKDSENFGARFCKLLLDVLDDLPEYLTNIPLSLKRAL